MSVLYVIFVALVYCIIGYIALCVTTITLNCLLDCLLKLITRVARRSAQTIVTLKLYILNRRATLARVAPIPLALVTDSATTEQAHEVIIVEAIVEVT